jgi:hypothetical protein
VIAKALECEGFNPENEPELEPGHPGHFTTGFGHQARRARARAAGPGAAPIARGGVRGGSEGAGLAGRRGARAAAAR